MFDYAHTAAAPLTSVAGVSGSRLASALASGALLMPTSPAGSGVALPVSVRDVLAGDDQFLANARRFAAAAVPLSIQPRDCGSGRKGIMRWQKFCEHLRDALSSNGRLRSRPAICLHLHALPLPACCVIADALLGRGPRFVYLDSLQMDVHRSRRVEEQSAANWTFLWRLRHSKRPLQPVYGGLVKSACPLLASEAATALLPEGGLLVPTGSHWLPVTLRLDLLANRHGDIGDAVLDELLGLAMNAADTLLDTQAPLCRQQQCDLRENRRIAFRLSGFGELVIRSRRNPADLSCLQWLQEIAGRIGARLHERSGALARSRGVLPTLADNDFGAGFGDNWRRHWQRAVLRSGVRHRNLVVMSPYAVLPATATAGPAFTDLLPLIALADAWSFAVPPISTNWNVSQFSQFHRRARAVIQGSEQASFIADGA